MDRIESQALVDESAVSRDDAASAEVVTKTDAQLQRDVTEELYREPPINAAYIDVQVEDGIVTQAGHVNSNAERSSAQHAAQQVSKVKALAVGVDVERPGSRRRHDSDIKRSVVDLMLLRQLVPKETIQIVVESGWLTLTGDVEWDYQKRAALDAVAGVYGVSGITDHIVVKSKVSAKVVKSKIEGVLTRRAKC